MTKSLYITLLPITLLACIEDSNTYPCFDDEQSNEEMEEQDQSSNNESDQEYSFDNNDSDVETGQPEPEFDRENVQTDQDRDQEFSTDTPNTDNHVSPWGDQQTPGEGLFDLNVELEYQDNQMEIIEEDHRFDSIGFDRNIEDDQNDEEPQTTQPNDEDDLVDEDTLELEEVILEEDFDQEEDIQDDIQNDGSTGDYQETDETIDYPEDIEDIALDLGEPEDSPEEVESIETEPGTHGVSISIAGDDSWGAWLNGEFLGQVSTGYHIATQMDFELPPGEHILAVRTHDMHAVINGMLASVKVDGEIYSVTGDGQWLATDTIDSSQWISQDYDDSAWNSAETCEHPSAWGGKPESIVVDGAKWIWYDQDCISNLGTSWFRLQITID